MSKIIDSLKNYYRYRHGRITAKDVWTIADEFIKENCTYQEILAHLLVSGFDVKTISKIINAVEFARGEQ